MRRVSVLAALLMTGACSTSPDPAAQPASSPSPIEPEVAKPTSVSERLLHFLEGSFDTTAQAKADAAFFPILLTVCRVDVPELGANVLYVEQARAGSEKAPYRQRVYVIGAEDDTVAVSRIFEAKQPAALVNLCSDPKRVTMTAGDLVERTGCAVSMKWNGERFEGSTKGKLCASTLQGATYATSEVTVTTTEMRSWDRGFDAADQQVWGATKGPYRFVRKTPLNDTP